MNKETKKAKGQSQDENPEDQRTPSPKRNEESKHQFSVEKAKRRQKVEPILTKSK